MATDNVFSDNGQWFFWDETGTAYLGPYKTEEDAIIGAIDYERYLETGSYSEGLQQLEWEDGEEF